MKILIKEAFVKAVENGNAKVSDMIYKTISDISAADSITQIKNVKKMQGFKTYYRIRIGDYRIGISVENNLVILLAFAHRKDIYKKFP